jgi:hypothetical protein
MRRGGLGAGGHAGHGAVGVGDGILQVGQAGAVLDQVVAAKAQREQRRQGWRLGRRRDGGEGGAGGVLLNSCVCGSLPWATSVASGVADGSSCSMPVA